MRLIHCTGGMSGDYTQYDVEVQEWSVSHSWGATTYVVLTVSPYYLHVSARLLSVVLTWWMFLLLLLFEFIVAMSKVSAVDHKQQWVRKQSFAF